MTVAVTGATGFVGSAICRAFPDARPLSRPTFDLNRPIDPALFQSISSLVHCAWDLRPGGGRINIDGTVGLFDAAAAAGVKHFVFISSLAAHAGARSVYGRSKYSVERRLLTRGGNRVAIVKPGTVLGDGGLFKSVRHMAAKLPALPLFFADQKRRLQTVWVDDLVAAVKKIVADERTGEFIVAEETGVTLREFYRGLAGRRPLVRCWGDGALLFARAAEAVGLRLPVTSDNLLGLKHLRHFDTADTNSRLDIKPHAFADFLAASEAAVSVTS